MTQASSLSSTGFSSVRTAARDGEPVIQVDSLHHSFGTGDARKQVLIDNNLELAAGEIVVMTGPSGSGKTTLLTLIGGLRSVQQGSVRVLGQELSGMSQHELAAIRQRIGFIFQAHNLFESLTASQNVRLARELHSDSPKAIRQAATEILTKLGLGHRLDYKPCQLSGGQRQRVAIARALVNRPKLILADEPTAALDKDSGRDVVNLLQKFARDDRSTVLLVTHDNRILDIADRIINMVDGHIISDVAIQETVLICEFLANCPEFAPLTLAVLSSIAEKITREEYPTGATVVRQGDPGDSFYLIRTGSVDVIQDDGTTSRVVRTLHVGDFFGEMALLSGQPRSATIRTRETTVLYVLAQADFHQVVETSVPFKDQLLKVIFQRQ